VSDDVLVKWADRLEWAATWAGHASNFNKSTDFNCMNDLAVEVRAERKRVAELEKRLRSEQARVRDLQVIHTEAYERSRPTELELLQVERDALTARVAELETPKTQIQELQVWGEENEIVNGEIIRRKRVLQYYVDKADGLQARLAELEAELRPFMTWTCANCGRINPGTMPYCPCREESDE